MLTIFDIDGTLTVPFTDKIRSGARELVAEARKNGGKIALATNQSGPMWRWYTANTKYPAAQTVANNIINVVDDLEIGAPDLHVAISLYDPRIFEQLQGDDLKERCFWRAMNEVREEMRETFALYEEKQKMYVYISDDETWRKPQPGMLLKLMECVGANAEETLYIGDMDSDEQAAEAAGVSFKRV